ncbi:SAM-dependent methyltransferase [Acrocarpospora sp. B8E8]|uniref:SAM-dependent methyltransferase n=1 Tax=Acrocarpospora sp. B8E8 TaxID=3153572 RepID=UPI00325D765D
MTDATNSLSLSQFKPQMPGKIDTSRPHSARVYDYWLGGRDNYEADRVHAEQLLKLAPDLKRSAQDNRAFLGRAVRYLVAQGVTQFIDIGTGIPTQGNTHEVAQAADPAAKVVYVDNDPIVLNHARALLTSSPEGRTAYVHADLREPKTILNHPDVREIIDFGQPVGIMLVAVLMFIHDADQPAEVLKQLTDAVPAGSHLVISHVTHDFIPPELARATLDQHARTAFPLTQRTRAQITRFFEGWQLVGPGLTRVFDWHPEGSADMSTPSHERAWVYAGVGRKS